MHDNIELEKYRQELTNKLLSLPYAHYASGKKEIVFRCPFCGDSRKDKTHGHFYVKVDFDEDEAPFYYCQKCKERGVVTDGFLKDLNLDSIDLMVLHKKHFMNAKRFGTSNKLKSKDKSNLIVLPPLNNKYSLMKMKYISDRLGVEISAKDMVDYKIIANFYDFINYNKIDKLSRHQNVCDVLDTQYVGFLSADNNYLNMRNVGKVDEKIFKRYINYNIFNYDDAKRMYIIPNAVDIMGNVKFVLSEGVFDILGVHNHIENRDNHNKIYSAVCGSGYLSVINYLIRYGFIHCDIDIYSDADVNVEYYRSVKKELKGKFRGKMTVHYNKLGKDYGVKKDEISLYKIRI